MVWLHGGQDPNGDGAPVWPRYAIATDQHMTIDVTPSAGSQLRRTQCDIWDQVGD
jgi:hypothetical protein